MTLSNKYLNDSYFEWKNYLGKLPIKNNVEKFYDENDIQFITNEYLKELEQGYDFEITNF